MHGAISQSQNSFLAEVGVWGACIIITITAALIPVLVLYGFMENCASLTF